MVRTIACACLVGVVSVQQPAPPPFDASGKHTGNWGEILSTYPLTAERAGR